MHGDRHLRMITLVTLLLIMCVLCACCCFTSHHEKFDDADSAPTKKRNYVHKNPHDGRVKFVDPAPISDVNTVTASCELDNEFASDALKDAQCVASKPDDANLQAASISKKGTAAIANAVSNTKTTDPNAAVQKETAIKQIEKSLLQLRTELDDMKAKQTAHLAGDDGQSQASQASQASQESGDADAASGTDE